MAHLASGAVGVVLAVVLLTLWPAPDVPLSSAAHAPPAIHKLDRRLTDGAAFWRCDNQRHDYAVTRMRYQWKDVTCEACLELRARGPNVPPIEHQANGAK